MLTSLEARQPATKVLVVGGLSSVAALSVVSGQALPLLALLLVVAFVVFFVASPVVAVLAFAAGRPLVDAYVHARFGAFSAGEAWGAALIVLFAIAFVRLRGDPRVAGVPIGFLLVFAAVTLWRPQTAYVISYGSKFAAWILVVLVVEQVARSRHGQELVFRAGLVSAALMVAVILYAIAENRYGSAYYATQFTDPAAGFTDPGQEPVGLSEFAVMALPFALFGALVGNRRRICALLSGAIGLVVIASYVRTTQLGLAVLFLGFAVLVLRKRHARAAVVVAFAPALAATVAVLIELGSRILLRFQDITYLVSSGGNKELAGSGRVFLWTKLVHSTLHSLTTTLIGEGAGASVALTVHDGLNKSGTGGVWAHSDIVETFITGGLVLCVAYVLLIVWLARPFLALGRDPRQTTNARSLAAVAGLAFVAFNVMSLASGIAYSSVATIATALLVGLVRGVRWTPGASFVDA